MPLHLIDPTQNRRVPVHAKCGLPIKGHKRGPDKKLICNVSVRQPSPEEVQSGIAPLIRSPNQGVVSPPPPYSQHGSSSIIGGPGGHSHHEGEGVLPGSCVAESVTESHHGQPYTPRPASPAPALSRSSSFDLPPVGVWDQKRRSKWRSPPTVEEIRAASSMVPTLLVDSQDHTVREGSVARRAAEIWERKGETTRQQVDDQSEQGTIRGANKSNPFIRILRFIANNPLVTAVPARAEDVPDIQEYATRLGLFTSLLHSTGIGENDNEENDRIVVIGQTPEMAQQYVEVAQRTMPGTIASDSELMEGPRMITTHQLVFVSIFSVFLAAALFLVYA